MFFWDIQRGSGRFSERNGYEFHLRHGLSSRIAMGWHISVWHIHPGVILRVGGRIFECTNEMIRSMSADVPHSRCAYFGEKCVKHYEWALLSVIAAAFNYGLAWTSAHKMAQNSHYRAPPLSREMRGLIKSGMGSVDALAVGRKRLIYEY